MINMYQLYAVDARVLESGEPTLGTLSTYPACKNLMTSPLAGLWVATLLAAPAASTAVIVAAVALLLSAVALLLSAVALLLSAVALTHGILLQASEDCAFGGVAIQADLVAVLQGFALALVQRVPRTTLRGTPQRRSSAVRAEHRGSIGKDVRDRLDSRYSIHRLHHVPAAQHKLVANAERVRQREVLLGHTEKPVTPENP